ncbi:uncharacterized protein METZ01_LOCUS127988, partial [marine metagenome]
VKTVNSATGYYTRSGVRLRHIIKIGYLKHSDGISLCYRRNSTDEILLRSSSIYTLSAIGGQLESES